MVEQVTINPEEVRGYGNVCEDHTLEDFIVSNSGLAKEKENVHGALTEVYKLVYSVYGLMFFFDKGNKQLYLQMSEADILSFGFDAANKQLYLVDLDDTGFNLGFDEDTNELYITDDAPPVVHNYSLALDSDSYTTTGSLSVSATLLDDGVAVEGATVSFTGGVSTVTATTNSSGVATATVNFTSSGTLTASYSNVSDTASVTVSHNYSLAFSSSSYVATDGSAEVSVTLLDDNVAVTGATISFTGGTSTVTGVTNSSGVATATVSVSATSTITATYNNVTDTCTVTVSNVIFSDDCTTDKTSTTWGSSISLRNSGTASVTFTSGSPNYYLIANTRNSAEAFVPYAELEGITDSFKLTIKAKTETTSNPCLTGLYYYIDSNNWGGVKGMISEQWISGKTNGTFNETQYTTGQSNTTNYYTNEITFNSVANTLTVNTYDSNDSLIQSKTMNIPITITSGVKWGTSTTWSNTAKTRVSNVKAEYI